MAEAAIVVRKFSEIDITDPFFDSLKISYAEFTDWFIRKAQETAYVSYDNCGNLHAFLYLKIEKSPITDVTPPLNTTCLKVGTFKIIPHRTKLGERFVKIIVDAALNSGLKTAYVTVFSKHEDLIRILETYGFKKYGTKDTPNGTEDVYVKDMNYFLGDHKLDYPIVNSIGRQKWLMAIRPEFHTNLFPDSKLSTEHPSMIQDVSHTNSIHKVYVGKYRDFSHFKSGDCVIIYRCQSPGAFDSAWFKSVATSLCVVDEVRHINSFKHAEEFIEYCKKHSVFDEQNLRRLYAQNGVYAVKLTYNLAFPKRPILRDLVENKVVPSPSDPSHPYYGLLKLDDEAFKKALELGGINEGFVIH